MKDLFITAIAAGSIASAMALPLSAENRSVFTDAPGLTGDSRWGTTRVESYDVAVHLGLEEMTGTSIASISFPFDLTEGFSNVSIWLSKELTVENKVNIPDIMTQQALVADGKAVLTLDDPYRISAEGVYVGITFTIENKETVETKFPVEVITGEDRFNTGFWVHTSSTYRNKWADLTESRMETPVFEVTLTDVPEYAAKIHATDEIYTVSGEEIRIPVRITNYGGTAFSTVTLKETYDNVSDNLEMVLPEEVGTLFGMPVDAEVTLPSLDKTGETDINLSIAKVGDGENTYADISDLCEVYVCSTRPEHTPLFEEYTGTDCGNCPRGTLGMEKLEEMYGDRFVGIAYHCSDVMSIAEISGYPNYAPAQPDSFTDRCVQADPYFGLNPTSEGFGIDKVWKAQEEIFAKAHLNLSCTWTDTSKEAIEANAEFSFVRDFSGVDFRIAYILVADGLHGEGRDWMQGNYYSGANPEDYPADFLPLIEAANPIRDMTYNHVAVLLPSRDGLEGSIPSEIEADKAMTHSFTLNLSDAVNLKGESLVQDKDKLHVVAAVVNATTGEVFNCAKAAPWESGITGLEADRNVENVRYLDFQGRVLSQPGKGMMIEVIHYTDGTEKVNKICR